MSGYNDYDSDLRYVRNLYHLIFQNKQNWADDTISIVVHWMVFYMGVFLFSVQCRIGAGICGLSVHCLFIFGLCDLSI
jgi:hypothetical protein